MSATDLVRGSALAVLAAVVLSSLPLTPADAQTGDNNRSVEERRRELLREHRGADAARKKAILAELEELRAENAETTPGLGITETLRRGSRGDQVKKLQEFLGLEADGIFGPGTERAVREWQREHGLQGDGIVGRQTREKMEEAAKASSASPTEDLDLDRTLRRGSEGEDVRRLQRFLGVEDDGDFGPGTERAVREWQRANGLDPDGVVGPRTAAAMSGEDPPEDTTPAGGGTLSGRSWVSQFPTSRDTSDLTATFGPDVDRFIAALRAAGANVRISATLRPPERAFLMHYAFRIARDGFDPRNVPARAGVDINWVHTDANGRYDAAASRQAARDMVAAYNIAYRPALHSRHTEGRAIDMTITWSGTLAIRNANGQTVRITSGPRTGAGNATLHEVGRTYGVRKLVGDPPHWSDDGH